MKKYSQSPLEIFFSAWNNRELIILMTRREILGRYRGSVLGITWSLFNPILMLAVYTFVFSVVLKARWHLNEDSHETYATILFAGMIVFGIFAECLNRAPSLILSNSNYIKKIVFPIEIMPWVSLGTALFHAIISFIILLIFILIVQHTLAWTVILTPLTLIPLILLILGLSWFISALGVYIRDVNQTVSIFVTVTMFVSPVFYPISNLPEPYRVIVMLNPIALILEQFRDVLLWNIVPDPISYLLILTVSTGVAWLGFIWFQKVRIGFADIL